MGQLSALIVAVVVVLVVVQVGAFFHTRLERRTKMKELGCELPRRYPHRDPFFGIDLFLDNVRNIQSENFLNNFKQRFDRYGQTFQAINMGKTAIHTNDPKNLQAVHALNFLDYGVQPIRRAPTLPFMGEGVFTMDGPFWQHSRDLIRPTFTRSNVANLSAFEIHFRKFLKLIPKDQQQVDLKPLLYKLFLDTSTEFLFGESINSLSPETPFSTTEFLSAFHYAQRGMGLRIRMGRFRVLHRDQKWKEAIKTAHSFAEKYVDKALEYRKLYVQQRADTQSSELKDESESDTNKRYILLHELAKETDDRTELRSQIIQVFLAGHDSTAITIGNAIFHLSRHPEKWQKLRKEVLALGSATLTFEVLKDMHYLQYIIRETLRLHPVAPTDTRIAYRDTILPTGGGPQGTSPILVFAGQSIISSYHALHRRPEAWGPDVEAFRPERWETCRMGWHYQPFGGGPRMCPGQNLALTEAAYVLARLAQEFSKCECRDEIQEWVEEMKITASSKNGVQVALTPA